MNKPQDYDNVQPMQYGDYETLESGGYLCKIVGAAVTQSNKGEEMLNILFDIADSEKSGFFQRRFDADTRAEKKWPGVYRQLTGGKSTPFFKGLITSLEQSNGFTFDWDEKKLKGKVFGGIFGREEYFNMSKGEYQFSTKLVSIRSVETIKSGKFEIPKDKLANKNQPPPGFIDNAETVSEDDLPF
jgi:hypothetical protein